MAGEIGGVMSEGLRHASAARGKPKLMDQLREGLRSRLCCFCIDMCLIGRLVIWGK